MVSLPRTPYFDSAQQSHARRASDFRAAAADPDAVSVAFLDRLTPCFGFHFPARGPGFFIGQQLQLQLGQRFAERPSMLMRCCRRRWSKHLDLQVRQLKLVFRHRDARVRMKVAIWGGPTFLAYEATAF